MISVLIVDDERIIREGLMRLIREKCPGFQIVGEAADGQTALELTRSLRPQVAIVDICMPAMGGIDYMRLAAQEPQPPRFIVLTGYADFEYARQTIGLGCEGYLLKPLKHAELIATMGRIAQQLEKQPGQQRPGQDYTRYHRQEEALRSLSIGHQLSDKTLHALGMECLLGSYWYILISMDGIARLRSRLSGWGMDEHILNWYNIPDTLRQLQLPEPFRSLTASITDRTTALILYSADGQPLNRGQAASAARRLREAVHCDETLSVTLGLSGPHQGLESFQQAHEQCVCAVGYRFYDGGGKNHYYDPNRPLSARPDVVIHERNLLSALDTGDGEEAARNLTLLLNRLEETQVRKSAVVMVLSKLYVEIINTLEKQGRYTLLDNLPDDESFETMLSGQDQFLQVRSQLERVMVPIRKTLNESEGQSRAVRQAIRFVQSHMNQPVGAADAAQAIGMNPSYFSVLFKKETGENFTNYVNRVKIERAKLLLRQPACKVYEVCSQVGIEDAKYFAKLFRRVVGMTPSEYREGKTKE